MNGKVEGKGAGVNETTNGVVSTVLKGGGATISREVKHYRVSYYKEVLGGNRTKWPGHLVQTKCMDVADLIGFLKDTEIKSFVVMSVFEEEGNSVSGRISEIYREVETTIKKGAEGLGTHYSVLCSREDSLERSPKGSQKIFSRSSLVKFLKEMISGGAENINFDLIFPIPSSLLEPAKEEEPVLGI